MTKPFFAITAIVGAMLVTGVFTFRMPLQDAVKSALKPSLPEPKSAQDFVKIEEATPRQNSVGSTKKEPQVIAKTEPAKTEASVKPQSESGTYPESVNLNVPFGAQAPFGDWSMPYQEACEEASVIMVHKYFEGASLPAETMDSEIKKLVDFEIKTFGYYADTNAAEIARMLKEYYGRGNVQVIYNFSLDDIKDALSKGYPVIITLAGREIGNPYFTAPGPIYHALVIKGYVNNKLITNDPGTRRGSDYLYDADVLLKAAHEWSFPDIDQGTPAIIIVKS